MTETFTLDPIVIKNAEVIYKHLGLIGKLKGVLKNDCQALPNEIQQMRCLLSTTDDKNELTKVVNQFIEVSKQSKRKGTLEEFIQVINNSIAGLCQDVQEVEESSDDEFDDLGFDYDFLLNTADRTIIDKSNSGNNKRPFDEITPTTDPMNNSKRQQKEDGCEQGKAMAMDDFNSINQSLSPSPSASTTSTMVSTPLTHVTTPDLIAPPGPTFDDEYYIQQYQKHLQQEATSFPGYNIIINPLRWIVPFDKAPWILKFELARIISICQVPWENLDLDTTQHLVDLTKTKPEQIHDALLKWQLNLRRPCGETTMKSGTFDYLNQDNDVILKLISIERCSDLVWQLGTSVTTQQSNNTDSTCVDRINDHQGQQTEQEQPPRYQDNKVDGKMHQTRSIHYTAVLNLPDDEDQAPTIKLHVPQFQASNRFFRKYGGERFLELRLAKFRSPDALRERKSYILRPFLLMGVTYQFLFMKDDRLILFATKGPGMETISILSVIEWHIPIIHNWGLTTCKFASRMGLGYSNSIPTLTFEPKNVRFIDDLYAKRRIKNDETCMTDGCGLISAGAMRKIMGTQQNDILPCAVQGRIGGAKGLWIVEPKLDLKSGDWIEIRASQNKFKTGLPGANMKIDPLHFTFDLVKNAFCIYPCYLNTQFIQCLAAGGVPTNVFVDLLKEHIGNMAEVISDNRNNRLLRDWLVKTGGLMTLRRNDNDTGLGLWQRQKSESSGIINWGNKSDNPEENDHELDGTTVPGYVDGEQETLKRQADHTPRFNRHSGNPLNLFESLIRLLDAGFDLSNPFLAKRMSSVFRLMMETMSTKYRVQVKQSCSLMCIPDPTGTLEPNQVFLQMSSRKIDEKTGIHAGLITCDILVARSPCGMKSDVQKVQAVDNPHLRIYSDVIVFSTQGTRSLASKLSGGDYDGDLIFCCWDKRLVDTFTPSEVPKKTEQVDLAFEKDTRTVRDELRNHRKPEEQETILQRMFLSVPTYDGTLGVYENWRTVVSEITSLDDPQVIYLAQMCALLVDAPKQGLWVRPWIKKEDRERFSVHPIPEWFADKLHKSPDFDEKGSCTITLLKRPLTTAMDHLHETIRKEIENLSQYAQSLIPTDKTTRLDPDLTTPWIKAWEAATELDDELMLADLKTLQDEVNISVESYIQGVRDVMGYVSKAERRRAARRRKSKKGGNDEENSTSDENDTNDDDPAAAARIPTNIDRFSTFFEVEEFHAQHFYDIGLKSMVSIPFKTDLMVNNGRMIHTLKASYAYILTMEQERYSKYCYVVAYDTLARIKSDACAKKVKPNGLPFPLVPSVYPAMAMDKAWIRKEKDIHQLDM